MKLVRMKNSEIKVLEDFLIDSNNDLKLKGRVSRYRTRFVKLLEDQLTSVREEHASIIKQYANLDDNGEPKTKDVEGDSVYDIDNEKMLEFAKEYEDLMAEDFVIVVDESNRKMVKSVRDAILDCELEFYGESAFVFDRLCDIIEGEDE